MVWTALTLEKSIAEIEWLELLYSVPDTAAPVVRPLRRQPEARRDVREQSVVQAVEVLVALWEAYEQRRAERAA